MNVTFDECMSSNLNKSICSDAYTEHAYTGLIPLLEMLFFPTQSINKAQDLMTQVPIQPQMYTELLLEVTAVAECEDKLRSLKGTETYTFTWVFGLMYN